MLLLGLFCLGIACIISFTPLWQYIYITSFIVRLRARKWYNEKIRPLNWSDEAVRVGDWRIDRSKIISKDNLKHLSISERDTVLSLAGPVGNYFGLEYTVKQARLLHTGKNCAKPIIICTPFKYEEVAVDDVLPDLRSFFPKDETL